MKKEQINTDLLPVVSHYRQYLREVIETLNISEAEARYKYGCYTYKEWNELLKPFKTTTMEKEFNQAIANKIDKLAANLKSDAAADFVSNYRNTGMTQADAEQLANDYILFYLSQEVYLKAAKNVSKHIVK